MATVAQVQEEQRLAPDEASQLVTTWRRFRKHRLGLIGLVTLTLLMLSVVVVPMISPFTYDGINEASPFLPAGSVSALNNQPYLLGTDEVGRDTLTRLFYAGRISLVVGLVSTVLVVIIGALVGALAGFYGGWVDTILMRLVDLLLSLPGLPILLILSQMLNSSGVMDRIFGKGLGTVATIILVFTIFGWLQISRLVRGSILSLRSLDFVEASRALGASNRRIILRHLMPNSAAPLIVAATLAVGGFIIDEAFLSFLGLGIQAPTPSWGNLLQRAQEYSSFITDINPTKEIRGYLILFPGLLILLTVLSINFMGDALRDALDPRLKM
jgi:peptide/nickel transport system permease protein